MTLPRPKPRLLRLLALLASLALSGPSRAAETDWIMRAETLARDAAMRVGTVAAALWRGGTSFVLPEAPFQYLPERLDEADLAFVATMESLGLTLSEIQTGGGILAAVSYRFVAAREPSLVDIARATRQLAAHRARFGGLRAFAQQRVLQNLLDVAGAGGFVIADLEIDLRPWPSIRYALAARTRPLDPAQRRLRDALRD